MLNEQTRAEARMQASMRRQKLISEAFTENERSTLVNVCHVAAERFKEDAAEFRKVATHLKNGGSLPMWARGEAGVHAAERLVAQFEKQEAEARELMEWFE